MSTNRPEKIAATTTTNTKDGQLRVKTDGGATYLTTEILPSSQTATYSALTTATHSATRSGTRSLAGHQIEIPRGFAKDAGVMLNAVLSFVMVVSALLVFYHLVMAAFDWITSGGDKGKTEKARNRILAAIIGIVIVASSFAVLTLVLRFIGFTSIEDLLNNVKAINS